MDRIKIFEKKFRNENIISAHQHLKFNLRAGREVTAINLLPNYQKCFQHHMDETFEANFSSKNVDKMHTTRMHVFESKAKLILIFTPDYA